MSRWVSEWVPWARPIFLSDSEEKGVWKWAAPKKNFNCPRERRVCASVCAKAVCECVKWKKTLVLTHSPNHLLTHLTIYSLTHLTIYLLTHLDGAWLPLALALVPYAIYLSIYNSDMTSSSWWQQFEAFNEHLEGLAPCYISILDLCGSLAVCRYYRNDLLKSEKSWFEVLVVCTMMQFGGTTIIGVLLGSSLIQSPSNSFYLQHYL